jgi:hypothetical protein
MPVTTPRAQSASRIGSIRSLLNRIWNEHRLLVLVLIPAVLLRIDTELGFRWQVWFNDSFDYIKNTVHFNLDPTRPSGYSMWLKVLEPFHTYALVTILQHLMGLAVAVLVYALARHRFGAPAWAATLATVPMLYDGFEIQLEHLVLADIPFLLVLTVAVTLLLWNKERPSLRRCAIIGLLLGISDLLRSVSLPLLIIIAVYLVIRRTGWQRIGVLIVTCALPVIAYAGLFDIEHGQFALTDSTGVFLYSRTMTFAECAKMSLPNDEKLLCTTVPPDQRPLAQAYIWTTASPLDRLPPSKFSPLPNKLAEKFAISAIEAQPLDYAKAVAADTLRAFGFIRTVFPGAPTYNEYLFSRFPLGIPSYNLAKLGPYKSYASAYNEGDPYTQVVQPFAAIIETYEKHVYLPGTIYGLILLVGAGGMVLGWRRWGGEALLPWTISLALIVVPAATAEFDYRYVLPAVPFACLAAVIAFAPGTPGDRWLRELVDRFRRRRESAVPARGAVDGPGRRSGDGPAQAGDDDRNLATDGA